MYIRWYVTLNTLLENNFTKTHLSIGLIALFLRVISGEYFESEFIVLLKGSETLVEIRSSGIVDKRAGTPAEIRLSGIADERADTSAEIRSSVIADERADTPAEIRSSGTADEGANNPPKIGSSKIVFPDRGANTISW